MNYVLRKNALSKTEIENVLLLNISNGAKCLYTYLSNKRSGEIINTQSLVKEGMFASTAMLRNYRNELKEHNLIHENKDGLSNIRFIYLGSLSIGALTFAEDWKRVSINENEE